MDPNEPKDTNVYSFMMKMVQEKHGDDVEADFLANEADRLYYEFGDKLLSYFEPMLNPEQKEQFETMVESGDSQEEIITFLQDSIENLEGKIMDVLVEYNKKYIQEE